MDAVLLSRIQFGLTTAFHIIFPTLTIGLAVYLVLLEAIWLWSRKEIYYRMYRFWVKIFAVNFAIGVVTGVTLEFEFGTNFARFSQAVANVLAPLMAYEAMTAFFLEAGFLGIMIFGWNRVSSGIHFLATCLVALGANLSAFWIMAAGAWLQTPAGYTLTGGEFRVADYTAAIFNPAMPTHLVHMLVASHETTAFAVAGISAYYLLKGKHIEFFRKSLSIALIMAAFFAPLQILVGDFKGINVARHQPIKLAALEAHWDTNRGTGAALRLFALPDGEKESNRFEVAVPNLLSLIITRSLSGTIQGLKEFPREDRPNVPVIFWSFRVMAGIGFLFLGIAFWIFWLWRRGLLFESRPFLKTLVLIQPLGFIAVITGWITAEMGRQPWVVYGLMRTRDAVSPIPAANVVWSLSFFLLFFGLIGASYFYYLFRILGRGPDLSSPIPPVQRPAGMKGSRFFVKAKGTERE